MDATVASSVATVGRRLRKIGRVIEFVLDLDTILLLAATFGLIAIWGTSWSRTAKVVLTILDAAVVAILVAALVSEFVVN